MKKIEIEAIRFDKCNVNKSNGFSPLIGRRDECSAPSNSNFMKVLMHFGQIQS